MAVMTIPHAARVLGVPVGTLRRWIREGCPVASRGHKGRGHAHMVDVDVVRQWRESSKPDALVLEIAAALPEVMAAASLEAWKQLEGADKVRLAQTAVYVWYGAATGALDYLRDKCPSVPDVGPKLPAPIEYLREIERKIERK